MLSRRTFLASLAGLTSTLLLPQSSHARQTEGRTLPRRKLGRSGEPVTMLGVGGGHVGSLDDSAAERQIQTALEEGVRFFDTAESYSGGRSERYFGRFLVPTAKRDDVFIMTKTKGTDAATVRRHLDESLKRLAVDRLDLWQIHEVNTPQDVDARIEQGVLDVFLDAKAQGKTRYIGFTGHRTPQAHLRMLERLAERGVEMDAVQMPVNFLDPHHESFIRHVLPVAVERGYAVLAMKTLAYGQMLGQSTAWTRRGGHAAVVPEIATVEQALSFVWSLPVSCLISGTSTPDELRQNCAAARAFTSLDDAARQALVDAAAKYDARGIEFYKA